MINNEEKKCNCENIFKENIYEKCFENEKISIYGHLTKGASILVRYRNDSTLSTLPMSIFFDNNEQSLQQIEFAKCKYGLTKDFCYSINLEQHDSICFNYYNDNAIDFYSFKINEDPFKSIAQRYNLDDGAILPIINEDYTPFMQKIKCLFSNIIANFKYYFSKQPK